MNGTRAKFEETPEGQRVAFIREWLYKIWPRDTQSFPPDYADIKHAIYSAERAAIVTRISTSKEHGKHEQMRADVLELLHLDALHGKHTPYSDCT
jgi:hypothetical protein